MADERGVPRVDTARRTEAPAPPLGRPLAAVYARVSTAKQAGQGLSLEEQVRLAVKRCQENGWAHEVITDPGLSGARRERPGLDRLMAALDRFDYVVVWKLDRLTRSTAHLSEILDSFQSRGVGLVSLTEPFDGSTAIGRAMIEIAGIFSALERSNIAERVRANAAGRVRRRRKPYGGGRRMYGRARDYSLRPPEVEIIRHRIVAPILAGVSELHIQRSLNEEGIPGPSGGRWHAGSIAKLLRRPDLAGLIRIPGTDELIEDADFPAVLDPETWAALCATLAARDSRSERRGRRAAGFLLTDPITFLCGSCGGPMRPVSGKQRKDGSRQGTYVCGHRKSDGLAACPRTPLDRDLIDSTIYGWSERGHLDVRATQQEIEQAARLLVADVRASLRHAERMQLQRRADLSKVERDYLDNELPPKEYARLAAALSEELDTAGREVERLREHVTELDRGGLLLDAKRQALTYFVDLRRTILERKHADPRTVEEHAAAVRAALARIVDTVIIGDLSHDAVLTAACFAQGNVVDEHAYAVAEGIATGHGTTYLEIVPRRTLATMCSVEQAGMALPLYRAGSTHVGTADNHNFSSQKTRRRPLRRTRSSS